MFLGNTHKISMKSRRIATSASQLMSWGFTTDGVYLIDLPTVGPTATYCILDTGYNGGGWMLALKATRGATFKYDASYWTTNNTLNETDVTLNDADAKYETYNTYQGTDLLARWPDIGQGGSISYGGAWTWLQNGYASYISASSSTLLNLFQTANNTYISGGKSYSGYGTAFSSQAGFQWYGFNYTGNTSHRVRWGFAWNNESNQATNDAGGGIGLIRFEYSAGDWAVARWSDSVGINRSARVEIYVR